MKQKQKHIVLLTPGFPENEADTTCIPALQLFAKKLQEEESIKLSIVTLHYPFKKRIYNWYSATVYALGFKNKFSFTKKSRVLKTINQIHLENPINSLHTFWLGECAYYGLLFSKKQDIKHICTLMGQDAKKGNRYVNKLALDQITLVSLSKFHQELFYKNYQTKTLVIPWGIEKPLFKNEKKQIDIIGVGSFIKLKNYIHFIKTIKILKEETPTIKAIIIGEGPTQKQLESEARKYNLENNILFLGKLNYNTTQQYIAQAKILLHPSHYESFGLVFAEALANKTFIVSKKTGFASDSEVWKTGDTVEDFARLVKEFLKNKFPEKSNYPQVKDTVAQYLKLYEKNH
ncbi:MAG: glycosyltransferase [Flavobacteriales bacterium]